MSEIIVELRLLLATWLLGLALPLLPAGNPRCLVDEALKALS